MFPDFKGQCADLAGQHQKKEQQNNPIPSIINGPKAEMYTAGWVNIFHRVLVSPDSFILKGVMHKELFRRCSYTLCTGTDGMSARCCSWVSLWFFPMCCQMQKCRVVMFTV